MRGLGKNVCNRIIVRRQWKHLDTCCHGLTHLGVLWKDQVDHHAFVKIIRLILQHDKEDDNDKKYDDDEDAEEKEKVKEE